MSRVVVQRHAMALTVGRGVEFNRRRSGESGRGLRVTDRVAL